MFLFRSQHSNEGTLGFYVTYEETHASVVAACPCVFSSMHTRTRASAPPPAAVGVERVARLRPNKGKTKGLKRQKGTQENITLIHFQDPIATVTSVTSKPKSKWRPLPLDTVVRVAAQSLGPTHSKFRISKNICEVSSFFFLPILVLFIYLRWVCYLTSPLF